MLLIYRMLEWIGLMLVLVGVAAMENPWYVPSAFMIAGAILIGAGAWGEHDIQHWRKEEPYDKARTYKQGLHSR